MALTLATSLLRLEHVALVTVLPAAFALTAAALFASIRTYTVIAMAVAVPLAAALAAGNERANSDNQPGVVFVGTFAIFALLGATAATLSAFAVWLVRRLTHSDTKRGR